VPCLLVPRQVVGSLTVGGLIAGACEHLGHGSDPPGSFRILDDAGVTAQRMACAAGARGEEAPVVMISLSAGDFH
jgi:hypothetical protein